MKRFWTSVAAGLVLAGSAVVGSLLYTEEVSARQDAAAQKQTPEQILELHTKADAPAGTAEPGKALYEKTCAACHRFGELGKDVGPDLTTITSRFKKRDVLEAILWPSKVISDQYQSEMLELKTGDVLSGVVVREDALRVILRTATDPDKPLQVPKSQIANREPSTVSLMPEGLLADYTEADVANLLAFVMAPAK